MTEQDLNLAQYEGKKVIVVKQDGDNAVEVEGTATSANAIGILIKPKGKTTVDIIEAGKIIEVRYVVDKPKSLDRKVLKPVEFGQARNHLLERHALRLEVVNGMDEKAAFDFHSQIDHVGDDLGHTHGDKNKTDRAEAIEGAGESSDEQPDD